MKREKQNDPQLPPPAKTRPEHENQKESFSSTFALVASVREGYSPSVFASDVTAGVTVAIVAMPLAMAFAIASGVEPERGLYTAIVAGFFVSLFGGSRHQIGGPTGAFVVVIYGVVIKHGYEGLALATLMAGALLIILGVCRFGSVIKFIPYPVTTGFTSGIALIIFSSQVKDFFGLPIPHLPPAFVSQWERYYSIFPDIDYYSLGLATLSITIILIVRKVSPKAPGPIVAIVFSGLLAWYFDLPVDTIESRFGDIPQTLPQPSFPDVTWEAIKDLMPSALTIALLGAIESLMSAVVADGMSGHQHHSNRELVGQGIANIFSAIMGGVPATGAIARTATNIRAGGRTSVSGIVHSFTLLAMMFLLAPFIIKIPMASLAAILVVVAWNMAEIDHFTSILRAPRSDAAVLFVTFFLTLFVDLTVAVEVGIVLASLLFIRRMIEVTEISNLGEREAPLFSDEGGRPLSDPDGIGCKVVPEGVEVYEINGPFFFGVAERLKRTYDAIGYHPDVFVLRMRFVPMMDATGIHALEELLERCRQADTLLILSGVSSHLMEKLEHHGFLNHFEKENILSHIDQALDRAADLQSLRQAQAALSSKR